MKYDYEIALNQVVTLASGVAVNCRPVPPYTLDDVVAGIPEPKYPYVKVGQPESGVETRPALRETPEFEEYQRLQIEYRKKLTKAIQEHELQYGIIEWKFPGMDEFVDMPPDGWKVPKYMSKRYGVETSEDPFEWRLQFIKFTLIQTDADDALIRSVIQGPTQALKAKELDDGLVPFDSKDRTGPPKSQ